MNSFAGRLPGLKAAMPEWWPILLGLMAMYVPTFYGLFNGLWGTEEQAQGPIVFVLSLWLLYRIWPRMMEKSAGKPASASGVGGICHCVDTLCHWPCVRGRYIRSWLFHLDDCRNTVN